MPRKKQHRPPNSGAISINPSGSVRAQLGLPGGKRPTKSFRTKHEADTWLREMSGQITLGLDSFNHNMLVSEFVDDWLQRRKPQWNQKRGKIIANIASVSSFPVRGLKSYATWNYRSSTNSTWRWTMTTVPLKLYDTRIESFMESLRIPFARGTGSPTLSNMGIPSKEKDPEKLKGFFSGRE